MRVEDKTLDTEVQEPSAEDVADRDLARRFQVNNTYNHDGSFSMEARARSRERMLHFEDATEHLRLQEALKDVYGQRRAES